MTTSSTFPAPWSRSASRSAASVCHPFASSDDPLARWLIAQGDRALVLAQRLGAQITRAPELDDDLAFANIAIDLLGQATVLYDHAGRVDGSGRNADDHAYWRDADQFLNPRLVERPDVDFAHTIVRQVLHDAYALELWRHARSARDHTVAAIADRAERETRYHAQYATHWLACLAGGTAESRDRTLRAVRLLLPDVAHLHDAHGDAPLPSSLGVASAAIGDAAARRVDDVLASVGLDASAAADAPDGRRHEDDFDALITEMQQLQRAHPGASW